MKKHLLLLVALFIAGVVRAQMFDKRTCMGTLGYVSVNYDFDLPSRVEFNITAPEETMSTGMSIYGPGQPRVESLNGAVLTFSVNTRMLRIDFGGKSGQGIFELPVDKWFNHRDWSYTTDWYQVSNPSHRDNYDQCYYEIRIYVNDNESSL